MDNEYYFTSKEKPKIFLGENNENINDILYYYPLTKLKKGTSLFFSISKNNENLKILNDFPDFWNYTINFSYIRLSLSLYQDYFCYEYSLKEDLYLINIDSPSFGYEKEKRFSLFFNDEEKQLSDDLCIEKYTNKKSLNKEDVILGSCVGKNKIIIPKDFISENNISGIKHHDKIFLSPKIMDILEPVYIHCLISGIRLYFIRNMKKFFIKNEKKYEINFSNKTISSPNADIPDVNLKYSFVSKFNEMENKW